MAPLVKKTGNQQSLYQDDGDGRRYLRSVGPPYVGVAKFNFRVGRQTAFADAPALHLSPIERGSGTGRFQDALRRRGAGQNVQDQLRNIRAMRREAEEASADDPSSEILIGGGGIDGHACRGGNMLESFVWSEGLARSVLKQRRKEDDVVGRQMRKCFEQ